MRRLFWEDQLIWCCRSSKENRLLRQSAAGLIILIEFRISPIYRNDGENYDRFGWKWLDLIVARVFDESNDSNKTVKADGQTDSPNLLSLVQAEKSNANLLQADKKPNLVGDFAYGVYEGSIARPVAALNQLGGKTEQLSQDKSTAQTVGEIAGTALPFIAVSALTSKGSSLILGEATQKSVLRTATEQGVAGFFLGSVLTPTELKADQSLLSARLKQGIHDSAIFAAMGGSANYLSRNLTEATTFGTKLGQRLLVGGGSGAAGGFVDAELRTGGKATWTDLGVSMTGYALLGATFEGGGLAMQSLLKPQARILRGSVTEAMASDPQTTVISNFAGWYDNLKKAIRTAPENHTIIVTEQKWATEGMNMLKSMKRPDVKILLDKDASAAVAKAESVAKPSAKAKDSSGVADEAEKIAALPSWELTKYLRAEAEKHGKSAAEVVVEQLKKNRVVMIGEYHVAGSAHNEWGAEALMPRLKGKATHLALEDGADLKLFKSDGKVDYDALPQHHQHREYMSMLQSAKDNGLKVAPIDVPDGHSRELIDRNRFMTEQLLKILEDKEAKVVFWVGNKHLQLKDSGDGPQAVQMLRDRGVSVSTFYGQHDNFWREEPVRRMFTPSIPLAVPTKDAPTLSSLNWLHSDQHGHKLHRFSEFDFVLMHPERRAYHFD